MQERKLSITVENLAPENGGSIAPFWFGFHNGQFQTLQVGQKASAGLEQLAEDGSPAGFMTEFTAAGKGTVQGALRGTFGNGGPFAPKDIVNTIVTIDPTASTSRYFSYASMILPSNDQFISNADAKDVQVFNDKGRFLGAEFIIGASDAWDAGTEVNDEIPTNTAFFGQTKPNTGTTENGVITQGKGFKPKGSGGILDAARFSNANYLAPDYQFAKVRIANLIEGGAGNERLEGTDAPDDIFAGDGNNIIHSGGGNDRITTGKGNNTIYAGAGDDVIKTGNGNNTIYAGGGNDRITTGSGNDTIHAGRGNDLIDAGDGNNIIFAGLGNDIIKAGRGNDIVYSGGGNNLIDTGTGKDRVFGGYGKDTFVLNAGDGEVRISGYHYGDLFTLGAGLTNKESIDVRIKGHDTILSNGNDVLAILQGTRVDHITFA